MLRTAHILYDIKYFVKQFVESIFAKRLKMTKLQFIKNRSMRSEVTWEEIKASGWDAFECNCGKKGCNGWALRPIKQVWAKRPITNNNFPKDAA